MEMLRILALLLCSPMLPGIATSAQAQNVYRSVGSDGKVSFSDRPATSGTQGQMAGKGAGSNTGIGYSDLPYALRQITAHYPVILYTSTPCAPCDAGRFLLTTRGIPFAERTVNTAEDVAALQRLSGQNALPVLTIGGQRIQGLSDLEWNQYLDAAGYPKTSQLAASYKNPAATPLVTLDKPTQEQAQTQEKNEPANHGTPPPAASGNNPAGIVF